MKTNKEIRIENWRGHGLLVIPAGSRVSVLRGHGYRDKGPIAYFVADFNKLFRPNSIEYHDATYYGIRVDAADVEE